mmetsp:Transcript_3994/g.11547  ORF Transcript_3994/g.11547 Transcript_3994/m.11547 type:complete len:392 (-) Transcript_3994:89-1264(-)
MRRACAATMKPLHREALAALVLATRSVWCASGHTVVAAPAAAPLLGFGPAAPVACPGLIGDKPGCGSQVKQFCTGNGECDGNGVCWCSMGWAGADCAKEVPESLNIMGNVPPWVQDMVGDYQLESMYLADDSNNIADMRFMYYEKNAGGWVLSKFNTTCDDDACFFAYEKDRQTPPGSGWVFGAPNMQVYCSKLVWDRSEDEPLYPRGKQLSVEYTPDPHVVNLPSLGEFNGQYKIQPRYVHANGKYMIMPINWDDQRTWIITGMMGVPRKWRLLASSQGPIKDWDTPPLGMYNPTTYSMVVTAKCANTYNDQMCSSMAQFCGSTDPSFKKVQACCRSTCSTCQLSRSACDGPASASLLEIAGISKPRRSSRGAEALMAKLAKRHSIAPSP